MSYVMSGEKYDRVKRERDTLRTEVDRLTRDNEALREALDESSTLLAQMLAKVLRRKADTLPADPPVRDADTPPGDSTLLRQLADLLDESCTLLAPTPESETS